MRQHQCCSSPLFSILELHCFLVKLQVGALCAAAAGAAVQAGHSQVHSGHERRRACEDWERSNKRGWGL